MGCGVKKKEPAQKCAGFSLFCDTAGNMFCFCNTMVQYKEESQVFNPHLLPSGLCRSGASLPFHHFPDIHHKL